MCPEKPNIHVIHFVVLFTLLQWTGTQHTEFPRQINRKVKRKFYQKQKSQQNLHVRHCEKTGTMILNAFHGLMSKLIQPRQGKSTVCKYKFSRKHTAEKGRKLLKAEAKYQTSIWWKRTREEELHKRGTAEHCLERILENCCQTDTY